MLTLDLINDQVQNYVSSLVGPYPSLKVRANFVETEGIEISVFRQERMFADDKDLKYVLWISDEEIRVLKWDLGVETWDQGTEFTSLIDFCSVFTTVLYRIYKIEYGVSFPDFLTALLGSPIENWKDFLVTVFENADIKAVPFGDSVAFDGNVIRYDDEGLTLEGIVNYNLAIDNEDDLFLGLGVLLTVYDIKKFQEDSEDREIEEISDFFGQIGFFPVNIRLRELLGVDTAEDETAGGGNFGSFGEGEPEFGMPGGDEGDTFDETVSDMGEEDLGGEEEFEAPEEEPDFAGGESFEDIADDLLQEDSE